MTLHVIKQSKARSHFQTLFLFHCPSSSVPFWSLQVVSECIAFAFYTGHASNFIALNHIQGSPKSLASILESYFLFCSISGPLQHITGFIACLIFPLVFLIPLFLFFEEQPHLGWTSYLDLYFIWVLLVFILLAVTLFKEQSCLSLCSVQIPVPKVGNSSLPTSQEFGMRHFNFCFDRI